MIKPPTGEPCVWVVIPTFNRIEHLLECIADLAQQDWPHKRLVVVDDAADPSLRTKLRPYGDIVQLLGGDGNRWWSGCMNLGLGWVLANDADEDLVLSFNDDVRVNRGYLRSLVAAYSAAEKLDMIGSLAVDSACPERVMYAGSSINWWKAVNKARPLPQGFRPGEIRLLSTDSLPGRGTLFSVALVRRIGFYDDRNFPQYFGDDDFSLRAKAAGAHLHVSVASVVLSHTALTGIGRSGNSLRQFLRSLFSIRSPNQLRRRALFGLRHSPIAALPTFLILDALKVSTSFFRRKQS